MDKWRSIELWLNSTALSDTIDEDQNECVQVFLRMK